MQPFAANAFGLTPRRRQLRLQLLRYGSHHLHVCRVVLHRKACLGGGHGGGHGHHRRRSRALSRRRQLGQRVKTPLHAHRVPSKPHVNVYGAVALGNGRIVLHSLALIFAATLETPFGSALGTALGSALGTALGSALETPFGNALGNALGTAGDLACTTGKHCSGTRGQGFKIAPAMHVTQPSRHQKVGHVCRQPPFARRRRFYQRLFHLRSHERAASLPHVHQQDVGSSGEW